MQNRYFGDVGDYGKYGLLRKLCGITSEGPRLSLGVVWYLVPNEGHNDDGKHISYLNKPEYRLCDPDLFDGLNHLLNDGLRTVSKIQGSDLLPSKTAYFDTYLSFNGIGSTGAANRVVRLNIRQKWLSKARDTVRDRDIVFLDPDNGLQIKSVKQHSDKGTKYVFWEEAENLADYPQTLVVYHHLNRTMSSRDQIEIKLQEFNDNLIGGEAVIPVLFKRGSHRVFFIIPSKSHKALIKARILEMQATHWSQHIEVFHI